MSGISWKEAKQTMDNVIKYLDTIDLTSLINEFKGGDLYDLRDKIEEIYPYEDEYSTTLFDYFSIDEVADYLNKKYNLNIKEEIISSYIVY